VFLGARTEAARDRAWSYLIPAAELGTWIAVGGLRRPGACPTIDRIARYVTRREVGIALSVGAAAGLAHFGVLEVLEEAGIPLDYLCGASMGGLAAIGYARYGNARRARETAFRHLGSNSLVRDAAWMPRAGLMAGEKARRLRERLFGDMKLADLERPSAVAAADLVAGERVVISSGPVARALHATSAIPGLFPPLVEAGRVMVDGGVVTRVPVDLLFLRRCGYRIAITVQPELSRTPAEREQEAAAMAIAIERPFGLRTVLGASWRLLGWWDSQNQAHQADAVIAVTTAAADGFNFDACERLVENGRRQAGERLDIVRSGIARMLAPGPR